MSVIDLPRRITSDWHAFNRCLRSADSLVYCLSSSEFVFDQPGSIDLCVGRRWFDPEVKGFYSIGADGLSVKPSGCVVVEVEQRLALPHNVMGLVTGKGTFIFQSALISTGKIDPGFDGLLRIGFFNASTSPTTLRTNQAFCSCCFFSTESEAKDPKRYEAELPSPASPIPTSLVIKRFLAEKWTTITPIAISLLTLVVAIVALLVSIIKE